MTCCCKLRVYWILVGSLIVVGRVLNWAGGGGPAVKFVSIGKTGFGSFKELKKGGVPEATPTKEYGSTWSWNIPNPARKTVVPLPLSCHAKPTRGWKSFFVTCVKLSFKTVVVGSVR